MQETWVWSLGWKDPMEKEMATHSSILAWEIPWTEGPGRLQFTGLQKSQTWQWLNNNNKYTSSCTLVVKEKKKRMKSRKLLWFLNELFWSFISLDKFPILEWTFVLTGMKLRNLMPLIHTLYFQDTKIIL